MMCMLYTADAQLKTAGSNMFAEPNTIPLVGQILLSGSLLWSPWNELCWCLCAGSGPTKGILDGVGEGAGWRFSHEMGFRWKMSASQNPNFSWEHMYRMQQKWYSWSQWEKGETNKKHRKEGKKFFSIPELEVWVLMIFTWDAEVLFH